MYRRKPGGHWYISVGGVRQSSGTSDHGRAKRLEHKLNAEAWDRHCGLTIPTWDQACLSWLKENPGPGGAYQNLKYMRWWKPHLTGKQLMAIDKAFIHGIAVEHLGADPKNRVPPNSTANGYVGFVSRIIQHGSKLRPDFIAYPRIRFRDRWLKPVEWNQIVAHMNPDARDLLTYLLATGQREANGMFLEWSWIDGASVFIPASQTKTKEPYGIPLNRAAQAVIDRRRQGSVKHLQYVFTRSGRPWYRAILLKELHQACKAAGVTQITVHGLRHTFTTWLARAGVPKEIRMRLTGHSGRDVHDGYTHFDVESLRPHSETIDEVIASAIATDDSRIAVERGA